LCKIKLKNNFVGGISGLFAALKLVENGFNDVTVLEADSRFGGRVLSLPYNDGVIELGAQWIHGRGECPLWKFVLDNQIEVTSDTSGDGDGIFYLIGGEEMSEDLLEECEKFSEELHWHLNKFYLNKSLERDDLPRSVGHFFEQQIKAFLERETNEDKLKLKRAFCDWFWKWELVDTGVSDLKKQSVKSWIEYVDYDMDSKFYEGEPILKGGYSKLVDFLVTSLTGRAKLCLDSKCKSVTWDNESKSDMKLPDIHVCLSSGEILSAGYAVIALPLGVLKKHHETMFQPPLPKSKVEIIEHLEFGLMDKIFLEFDEIFWNIEEPGLQFIMNDDEFDPDGVGDLANTWWRSIAGFDSVCGQPKVLCGWISGHAAQFMETLTDDQILDACWNNLLKRHVGSHVKRPINCVVNRWGRNENILGSYSYTTPNCDLKGIGANDLAKPVTGVDGHPRLLFCGEASDVEHYGTVTGAMVAGCREGIRLSKLFNQKV